MLEIICDIILMDSDTKMLKLNIEYQPDADW